MVRRIVYTNDLAWACRPARRGGERESACTRDLQAADALCAIDDLSMHQDLNAHAVVAEQHSVTRNKRKQLAGLLPSELAPLDDELDDPGGGDDVHAKRSRVGGEDNDLDQNSHTHMLVDNPSDSEDDYHALQLEQIGTMHEEDLFDDAEAFGSSSVDDDDVVDACGSSEVVVEAAAAGRQQQPASELQST